MQGRLLAMTKGGRCNFRKRTRKRLNYRRKNYTITQLRRNLQNLALTETNRHGSSYGSGIDADALGKSI